MRGKIIHIYVSKQAPTPFSQMFLLDSAIVWHHRRFSVANLPQIGTETALPDILTARATGDNNNKQQDNVGNRDNRGDIDDTKTGV